MPPPSDYTCEGCNETMPRTKLTKIKVLNRRIAGVGIGNTMTASVVGTGSFFDATQATSSLTIPNCVFRAGDCCVVCLAMELAGGTSDPASVSVGGQAATNNNTSAAGDLGINQWDRGNLTAGSKSVVISVFGANPTACAAVVVAVSRARLAVDPFDGFGSGQTVGTTFDSGSLVPSFNFEMAIAMVGSEQNNAVSSWGNGFTALSGGHVATNQGGPPQDVTVDVAIKALLNTDPVQVTGTIGSSAQNIAGIITIRPQ